MLAKLRARGAVATIAGGMPYVTRHPECRAVLRDTDSFSNASGFKAPGVVIPTEDRLLGELDPPLHTPVRRAMVTVLSPKAVHAAEDFARVTAEGLLDTLAQRALDADLVPGFTVPLPNRVTVHLLGFPAADADLLAGWAKGLMTSTFPLTNATDRGVGFAAAFPEFAGYIDDQLDARRAAIERGEGGTDVPSRLLALEVDGAPLPASQVRALTRNLITGGLTTTSQLLGNLLYEILRDPGVEAALRGDPDLVERAIDESLRLSPPVLFVPRGCKADTEVAGCPVAAGERLIVGTASANRDEQVFADPDAFRLDRENADQHLTFGFGPHVCPGATLARMVARTALRAFFDRFAPGEVALAPGYEFENVETYFEVGPRALPVVLAAR